jgi:hypothetical protein
MVLIARLFVIVRITSLQNWYLSAFSGSSMKQKGGITNQWVTLQSGTESLRNGGGPPKSGKRVTHPVR